MKEHNRITSLALAPRVSANMMRTNKQLKKDIVNVMKHFLGNKNGLSQKDLFEAIYGNPELYTDMQVFFMWGRVVHVMAELRKGSLCFIASKRIERETYFFVLKDAIDSELYKSDIRNKIRGFESSMKRADRAVAEKFYEYLDQDVESVLRPVLELTGSKDANPD